ncbi:MAG: MlaD family protein [Candidatus Margulisbacteria bacterium]|nr:MlaD family protein [Candidatus Margulisiibacteriota bacterium]
MSTAVKVGIVTLIGLILIGMVIVWKSELLLVGKGYELRASFESIEGLTVGSEVRYRGLKVGKVMRIDPGPYDIKIYSVIAPDMKIPADSILRVSYDGIVGLKYLEIRPGTSETMYVSKMELQGLRTAAIVDFIDIGSKNLVETKAILENVRKIIENPKLQAAFTDMVYTADKVSNDIEKLTDELRQTNQGIKDIVTDPKFQANVKGTIAATDQTLTSANKFFENVGRVNMRASGGVDIGSRSNAVRGDVDIIQSERTYYRIGFGEGPTRQPGLLDFLLTNKMDDRFGFRLGVINSQLGGGVIYQPTEKFGNVIADIYDINNPRPNNPRVRVGYEQQMQDYMDLLLQADDILNSGNSNFMFGVRVKSPGERLY